MNIRTGLYLTPSMRRYDVSAKLGTVADVPLKSWDVIWLRSTEAPLVKEKLYVSA
jgi:hypothetical protein